MAFSTASAYEITEDDVEVVLGKAGVKVTRQKLSEIMDEINVQLDILCAEVLDGPPHRQEQVAFRGIKDILQQSGIIPGGKYFIVGPTDKDIDTWYQLVRCPARHTIQNAYDCNYYEEVESCGSLQEAQDKAKALGCKRITVI